MKLLDKYVLKEMIGPFLISLFAFVVLWVGRVVFDNMDVMFRMRTPVSLALRLVIYQLPWVLCMSLPFAVLFAVSLAVNRLGRDSEITAIRMAGTPIRRVFLPMLIVGLLLSVVTLWMGESVEPRANHEAERTKRFILGMQPVPPIQQDVFFRSDQYCFYVQRVDRSSARDVTLQGIMIYELPAAGQLPTLTTAKWATNEKNLWVLHDGVQRKIGSDGFVSYEMGFPVMKLDLNRAVQDLWDSQRTAEEMSFSELRKQISLFGGVGQEVTQMKVDWNFKLSIPLSCLVFALCAAPLSLRFSRVGSYSGILLGVVITFFYWNIIFLGKALGMSGLIPPVLAGWAQNIVFVVMGIYLMWREE